MTIPINRVAFIIDGFNLYHSLKTLSKTQSVSTKWLDLKSLCESYLHLLPGNAQNAGIFYFSALANHINKFDKDTVKRHRTYLTCLTDSGVDNQIAKFKKKLIRCPHCNQNITRYEEKETDVAISVKILELCVTNACDSIVVLTGDTDVAPAIRTVTNLFTHNVYCLFPYDRTNNELTKISKGTFQISKAAILSSQFQNPYVCKDGTLVNRPALW